MVLSSVRPRPRWNDQRQPIGSPLVPDGSCLDPRILCVPLGDLTLCELFEPLRCPDLLRRSSTSSRM
jgi:hypothetical protein